MSSSERCSVSEPVLRPRDRLQPSWTFRAESRLLVTHQKGRRRSHFARTILQSLKIALDVIFRPFPLHHPPRMGLPSPEAHISILRDSARSWNDSHPNRSIPCVLDPSFEAQKSRVRVLCNRATPTPARLITKGD